jgi:O-antigen/teichoic acid export membrane protein
MVRDVLRVGSATIICQVLAMASSLWLRHVIDPTRMGVWQALKLFLGYSNYANLGISKGAAREWSAAHGSGQLEAARRGLNLAFAVNTLASLACGFALLAAAAWRWSSGAADSLAWSIGLAMLAVVVVLQRHVSFQVTILRAGRDFRSTSRLSILEGWLTLVIGGVSAWCWGVYGLYLSTIVVLVASWIYLCRSGAPRLSWQWDRGEIRRLIAIGGPIVLAGAATTLFRSLDKLTILCFLDDAEFQLGCYSLALLVGGQLYGLANMLMIVAAPRLAERFGATASRREVAELAARTSHAQAMLLSVAGAVAIVAAPPILARGFPDYRAGLAPLTWIVAGAVALGMSFPAAQYLVAVGRERWNLAMIVLATGITAIGNYLAIAHGGGTSAVAATMPIGNLVYALGLSVSIARELPPAVRWRSIAAHGLALVPAFAMAIAIESRSRVDESWIAATALETLAVVAVWAVSAGLSWLVRPCHERHPAAGLDWQAFTARCQKPDHRRIGNWFARRVSRPLALHVTWVILPTGISAHAVTLVTWACGLLAVVALGVGGSTAALIGAALLQVWYLLDHVDGQVARWRSTQSLDGVALDYTMHHSLNLLVPLGIGYGLARTTGSDVWWLIGAAWGLGLLLLGLEDDVRAKACVQRLKRLHGRLEVEGGGGGRPQPQPVAPRSLVRRVAWLARKACEVHVMMNALTVLALADCGTRLVGWPEGWLVVNYAAIMAPLALGVAIVSLARRVRGEAAEREFAAWYRVPEGHLLVAKGGDWHVVDAVDPDACETHSDETARAWGSS